MTIDTTALSLTLDSETYEVESLEEAAELAKAHKEDATVYDEPGFVRGYVKATGDWRAA